MTRSRAEFDNYAEDYQELLRDPIRERFAPQSSFFAQRKWILLRNILGKAGRQAAETSWLDVGCGLGDLLYRGKPFVRVAAGCDLSPEMLARCHQLDVRRQPSPTSLPYPNSSFDLITAVCVYHHVEPADRAALTSEIVRVLAPGGLFCIIEHNPYNPVTRLIVRRTPVDAAARLLTARQARSLMRAAGLTPALTRYFLYLPEKIYARAPGVEGLLDRAPLGGQYIVVGSSS